MSDPAGSLSEEILAANRVAWDEMQRHHFVADIEADRLPDEVFRRYLVYEGAFVATAITIFGHAVIKAPGIDEQRWLIGVLRALAEEQIGYFEMTFDALGIDPAAYPLPPAVEVFRSGMRTIAAEGSYLDIVAAMFAAEWMYWHWCSRAAGKQISDPVLKRWVDLHAAEEFAAQARWLKDQLDRAGPVLDAADRRRLAEIFGEALRLEIAFHTAPYEPEAQTTASRNLVIDRAQHG